MTAGTHDDGRLFGMGADGTIWTEPALELRDDTIGDPATCPHAETEEHEPWDPCPCGYEAAERGHGCVCPCHPETDPAWCATCRVFVDYPADV